MLGAGRIMQRIEDHERADMVAEVIVLKKIVKEAIEIEDTEKLKDFDTKSDPLLTQLTEVQENKITELEDVNMMQEDQITVLKEVTLVQENQIKGLKVEKDTLNEEKKVKNEEFLKKLSNVRGESQEKLADVRKERQKQLEDNNEKIVYLQKEVNCVRKDAQNKEDKLHEKNITITKLEDENGQLSTIVSNQAMMIELLEQRLAIFEKQAQNEAKESQKRLAILEKQAQNETKESKKRISLLVEQVQDVTNENENQDKIIYQNYKRINSLEEQVQDVTKESESKDKKVTISKDLVRDLTKDIKEKDQKINILEEENVCLKQQIKRHDSGVASVTEKCNQMDKAAEVCKEMHKIVEVLNSCPRCSEALDRL